MRQTLHSNSTPPPQLTDLISPLSLNIEMSDREVGRITRRRRSILESGRPSLNGTILDSDLVVDEHELVNKFKTLKIKISAWQCFINYDPYITIDIIKAHHVELKGEIHSLYHESILAHTSEKLSYDILGLISVIDRIKGARFRLVRGQEAVSETGGCN